MCGIVGAIAQRNVSKILIEGLKRLEYRGYDSAGLATIDQQGQLQLRKRQGKVANLQLAIDEEPAAGHIGVAHTRWATHGEPSDTNAHPHISGNITVVHNGVIENHQEVRQELIGKGYIFLSETDSEVIVHQIEDFCQQGFTLIEAVKAAVDKLHGAYSLGVMDTNQPNKLIGARSGTPLVLGIGIDEYFLASDQLALRQVTDRFIFLEEGDLVELTLEGCTITNQKGDVIDRKAETLSDSVEAADKGEFRHYMLKEIYEQPKVIEDTLRGRIGQKGVLEEIFGLGAKGVFDTVKQVQIVACGTSYHAGLVARYWIEDWAGIPCQVEVASEFRYRKVAVQDNTLFISISQSGETADTLEAVRIAKRIGYFSTLAVCNVANSSLVRESDLSIMTIAGPEIGVASTKAFTTQLVVLQLLSIVLARRNGLTKDQEIELVNALKALPNICQQVLALNEVIEQTSEKFAEKQHALFLGRGVQGPVAMEGALKLKEISYIHAEAYPAGELKHGPLALVDADMPVVTVAPNNDLLEKLKSNIEVVQARGGKLFVFADKNAGFEGDETAEVIAIPYAAESIAPIVYTLPLQLLSYHVAVFKGTDVDQPRNLAKSVTVE